MNRYQVHLVGVLFAAVVAHESIEACPQDSNGGSDRLPASVLPSGEPDRLACDHFGELRNRQGGLAAVDYPLPIEGDFRAELECLAQVVTVKLEALRESRCLGGGKNVRGFAPPDLKLTFVWQRPEFRQPLLRLLRECETYRYYAAKALLGYDDPALRAEVEKFRGFQFTQELGDMLGIRRVTDLLDRPQDKSRRSAFEELDSLLPTRKHWEERSWPPDVSLPVAVDGLDSENLSIRVQSWAWFRERGICAPTKCVEEAWPALDDKQRWYVCSHSFARSTLGTGRLRLLYEWLLGSPEVRLSSDLEGMLLGELGGLGSWVGRERAKRIIEARLPELASDDTLRKADKLLRDALWAFSLTPEESDDLFFVGLAESWHEEVRGYGWAGLAKMSHPDTIERLRQPIVQARFTDVESAVRRWRDLGSTQPKHRWKYLDILAEAIATRKLDRDNVDLLDTFYALAGVNFGFNGRLLPHGFDAAAAAEAKAKCLAWYESNKP